MRSREYFKPKHRASDAIKRIDFRTKDIICFASDYSEWGLADDLPFIELVEYEIQYSTVIEQILYLKDHLFKEGDWNKVYNNLYILKPTLYSYVLPYYTDYHHATQQGWQEMQGTGIQVLDQGMGIYEGAQKLWRPAAGIVYPRAYSGANEVTYSFTFDLVNTISTAGAMLNKKFLERLIDRNLHAMTKAMVVQPPSVYEIYIPGVRWSPASVIQGLTVQNIGTINNWKNYIVPDTWRITLLIRELINESRNLYKEAIVGNENGKGINVTVYGGAR